MNDLATWPPFPVEWGLLPSNGHGFSNLPQPSLPTAASPLVLSLCACCLGPAPMKSSAVAVALISWHEKNQGLGLRFVWFGTISCVTSPGHFTSLGLTFVMLYPSSRLPGDWETPDDSSSNRLPCISHTCCFRFLDNLFLPAILCGKIIILEAQVTGPSSRKPSFLAELWHVLHSALLSARLRWEDC